MILSHERGAKREWKMIGIEAAIVELPERYFTGRI